MSDNKLDYDVHVAEGEPILSTTDPEWIYVGIQPTPKLRTIESPVLLDHFAMSFIQRGDTVQDAFRNAALAMEERKKYL